MLVELMAMAYPSLFERFAAKVAFRSDDGCWLWTGSIDSCGYGRIKVKRRTDSAHRVSWQIANGAIPIDLEVCHKCDTPACVRPSHLFLGTHAENIADRDRKGRRVAPRGEQHGRAKLTAEQVAEIRRRRAAGESERALGRAFGVHGRQIRRIALGEQWNANKGGNDGKGSDGSAR